MHEKASRAPDIPRHFELRGWRGYVAVLVLVGLARLISDALPANPPAPYYLAILLSSLWAGRGPGLLAAILSAVATAYFDLGTGGRFDLDAADLVRLVIFFVLALITGELVASRRDTEESLRRTVLELDELDRAKDEFIATITHDLRSPLTSILGWSELLKSRAGNEDPELKTGLNSIIRSARVQSRLVDDLLEASRVRVGKINMQRESVDLVALVAHVLDSFAIEGERQRVDLRREIEVSHLAISGDPERLEQMLRNLVSNALKFTPSHGAVTVSLTGSAGVARLQVSDSGSGISPELLSQVFNRFSQAEGASRKGGLGLGLSIVRHIVELHGGRVEARSEGKGRGSTFIVELPMAERGSTEDAVKSEKKAPSPSGMRAGVSASCERRCSVLARAKRTREDSLRLV